MFQGLHYFSFSRRNLLKRRVRTLVLFWKTFNFKTARFRVKPFENVTLSGAIET